jgi:hypothetical protein
VEDTKGHENCNPDKGISQTLSQRADINIEHNYQGQEDKGQPNDAQSKQVGKSALGQ